jgi:translocation and assembly module TamB
MKRAGKIVVAAAGVLLALPLLCAAIVLVGANTGPGRDLIGYLVPWLTDGKVAISGLSGRFPDRLRVARISIADAHGTWLRISEARLDWAPLQLLRGEALIETLAAAHVVVQRLPESSSQQGGGLTLPARIAVAALRFERLDLAAPIAGAAAALRLVGDLHLASLQQGSGTLDAERLDAPASYKLSGTLAPDAIAIRVEASERPQGLLSRAAGLPDLGPLSFSASLAGPRHAERARLSVSAGELAAHGEGTIDLDGRTAELDFDAIAPAMAPRPDLRWQSARLAAHLHGALTSPRASGHMEIDGLEAGGGTLGKIEAELQGDGGTLDLSAALSGVRLSGAAADLFAAAPFELRAKAVLNSPQQPITFTLSHPLLGISGEADTAALPNATITLTLPSLAPYAAAAGVDIEGRAALTAKLAQQQRTTRFGVDGTIDITGGRSAAVALVGDKMGLALAGSWRGGDIVLDHLALDGKALHVAAKGAQRDGEVDLGWQAKLSDLSALAAKIAGTLSAEGHVSGKLDDLTVSAQASGDAAPKGLPTGPFTVSLRAQGLPSAPSGTLDAQARFAGAPLRLAASATRRADETLDVALDRLQWKSATGQGKLTLAPGTTLPQGQLQLRIARLADLMPLTGVAAEGSLDATFDTVPAPGGAQARVRMTGQNLAAGGGKLDRLTVDARVNDALAHPTVAAVVNAEGIRHSGLTGNARLTADGTLQSLALRLTSALQAPHGQLRLAAAASARLPQRDLQLSSLEADYPGETARLLAPARIGFADGVAVDKLRLGIGRAVIMLAGRLAPTFAIEIAAQNLTPGLAKPFFPGFDGVGTLTLEGQFRGGLAAPLGRLHLSGRGLRLAANGYGGLPPAEIDAAATIADKVARIDARLAAGTRVHLRLSGTAPLQPAAPLALRLDGDADLAMLDPLLTPNGRTARGQLTIALGIAGTPTQPHTSGTIRLARGSLQDLVQGIHLTDIGGLVEANGEGLRIAQLTGHAGDGTVAFAGTIDLLRPEMPMALTVTARNARPLASDLLSAVMDADLTLEGQLSGTLRAAGTVRVRRADINLPDSLPQSVAVLQVRRPGAKPATPRQTAGAIALDLTVAAPERVFVRGHGVDAEMGGTLKVAGSTASPQIGGGFDLRRGTFSLAGQTLTFTSGKVAFGGSGLAGKLDPSIDFVAQTAVSNLTATLSVTGYADAPKLKLSSAPPMPQDEILGQLLFGQSLKQLSPFQIAAIAQGLASFGGVTGGDPLATVRSGLGLDRLSVGAASTGGGATVEAGKYVARGVFVGARQDSTGGTQAKVQIDLTRHLKVESRLGTGSRPATGVTPENDPGSSLGLTYRFEY